MESWLPTEIDTVFVCIFGYNTLELSDNMRQPPASIRPALHFFVFCCMVIARCRAVALRCRAVALRQPYGALRQPYRGNPNNQMDMIGHDNVFWDGYVRMNFGYLFDTLLGEIPDFGMFHLVVNHRSEEAFSVLCAKGYEVIALIITMPFCSWCFSIL